MGQGILFVDQSYLTFNVGAYRTAHSNLDALAITLYGAGLALLPGAGLYTYQPGAMRNYFHGTASHDTVVVDHRDQAQGAAAAGAFVQEDGITYQTGESALYDGVTHRRAVVMLDKKHFLVIDRLSSERPHTYDQMFHLFPGAHVAANGLTVTGTGATPAQSLTIEQLSSTGIERSIARGQTYPPAGLCSRRYQMLLSCAAIDYRQSARRDAAFTTLLTIGPPDPAFRVAYDPVSNSLAVRERDRKLAIHLSESGATPEVASSTDPSPPKTTASMIPATGPGEWLTTDGGEAVTTGLPTVVTQLTTSGDAPAITTDDSVRVSLADRNLLVRFRVIGVQNLGDLELQLSNDHWATTASNDIRNAYPARYDGEWLTLSLGRGELRDDRDGHWTQTGATPFDWSRVDGVRFVLQPRTRTSPPATLELASIATIPQQPEGVVVFMFDDGYDSILPAADYLHRAGMPANVAVIGKYVELPTRDHLTVDDLRMLQNRWGWNMANHTQSHIDAVRTYTRPLRLGAYEQDILQGAEFLQQAGLDSARNWFIYPHGTIDSTLEPVVHRFYKFARTTDNEPEAYPFGDPLRVKTLEIQDPADSEGGAAGVFTAPSEVQRAVLDAKRFHLTLILTFHRIHSQPSDPPGYPLADFRSIVDGVRSANMKVTTLSGLDAMMGVPEDNHIDIRPGSASQILVSISAPTRHRSLLARLFGGF